MKLEALLTFLLPDVPGVPDVTAKQALLLTAIDFCTSTHAWDEIQDPITLEDGVNEYIIDTAPGTRIAAIKNVWLADRVIVPKTMEELPQFIPNWQTAASSIPAYYNAPASLESIRVFPIPLEPNGAQMTVRAAYTPTLSGTYIPDELAMRYLDAIIHGAKARLMTAPGKGWSNPALATYHQQQYDSGVLTAKGDILHDKVQGSIRVKSVKFGY